MRACIDEIIIAIDWLITGAGADADQDDADKDDADDGDDDDDDGDDDGFQLIWWNALLMVVGCS